MLSRGRMTWLHAHPATHRKTEKERQVADGAGGWGWARKQIKQPHEWLVLYKAFNTLCCKILSLIIVNKLNAVPSIFQNKKFPSQHIK
jgi:hypothetical protein